MDVGFFYLINHGLDLELLDQVFEQSKNFFALPMEQKMKVLHDKNHRGYTPFEEEILDPAKQSKGDSKEGYYIGREVPDSDPRSKKPLHGPNQYPSSGQLSKAFFWSKMSIRMHFKSAANGCHPDDASGFKHTSDCFFPSNM